MQQLMLGAAAAQFTHLFILRALYERKPKHSNGTKLVNNSIKAGI